MNTIDREPRSSIRKLQFLGCTAILLAVGGFGGWGTTTEIAGAVIANGTVVVESKGHVKKVQHLTGGIISELRVKEGSEVEADQVLIRLDDTLNSGDARGRAIAARSLHGARGAAARRARRASRHRPSGKTGARGRPRGRRRLG